MFEDAALFERAMVVTSVVIGALIASCFIALLFEDA